MDYQSASSWLLCRPSYHDIGVQAYHPSLDNTRKLLAWLGAPEKRIKAVHVAGTNGKGSVSHILSSVFQENHYKTGLYTSPHFKDFRERIKINGNPVREDFVVSFVERIQPLMKEINPSFFELLTALAFSYFDRERVEIAVFETGLGGRLDATNLVEPLVTVVTSIGMDHADTLGESLLQIAAEKAGIMKSGVPLVLGEVPDETFPVFADKAKKLKVDIHRSTDLKIESDLLADYQTKNLNVANAVVELMRAGKWQLNKNDTLNGYRNVIINTGFQGRMQVVSEEPMVIFDGAHNGHGIAALMKSVKALVDRKLHVVFGVANDKLLGDIFVHLPLNATYYFTEFRSPRSQKIQELSKYASERGLDFSIYTDPAKALATAKLNAVKNDTVLVCGSFYLLSELLSA